ncbi:MAG: zf-HC2 domain-containing protein [Candidatus Krumholzibacteria bacterium]
MNCRDVLSMIRDYMDGELNEADAKGLQKHCTRCASCNARVEAERELKFAIRTKVRSGPSPPGLAELICRDVRKVARGSERRSGRRTIVLSRRQVTGMIAGVVIVVALGVFTTIEQLKGPGEGKKATSRLTIELVDDHIRYLSSNEPAEFVSSNRREAEQWFTRHLDIAVTLPRFDAQALVLRGGRLCYVLDRRVALLFYGRGEQTLSLFVMDASGLDFHGMVLVDLAHAECATENYKGYKVLSWRREGLLYALVGGDRNDGLVKLVSGAYEE